MHSIKKSSRIPANFLALSKWLGNWAVAALMFSSRLVEREGCLVTAALQDWIASSYWFNAGSISIEATLESVKALVPLTLIFRESSGELKITLANASSTRAESVGALDVLATVAVHD